MTSWKTGYLTVKLLSYTDLEKNEWQIKNALDL